MSVPNLVAITWGLWEIVMVLKDVMESQGVMAKPDTVDTDRAKIRDGLAAAGVIVKDTPQGTEWELSPDFDAAKLEAL